MIIATRSFIPIKPLRSLHTPFLNILAWKIWLDKNA